MSDKHTVNGFMFLGNADNVYSANKTNPDWRTTVLAKAFLGAGTWTWLPNASWANAFRVGYARNNQKYIGVDVADQTAADLGLPTGVTDPPGFPGINNGYPQSLAINGFTALGSRNTELEGPQTSLEFNDTINYLTGNHNIRFGGMIIMQHQNGGSWADTRGRFGFGQGASGANARQRIDCLHERPDRVRGQHSRCVELLSSTWSGGGVRLRGPTRYTARPAATPDCRRRFCSTATTTRTLAIRCTRRSCRTTGASGRRSP